MRVGLGSDEDLPVLDAIAKQLNSAGHEVVCLGAHLAWPEVGRLVAQQVAEGALDRGVVCCWTGTGVSIAANKVKGVRAALCTDAVTAIGARQWNDANVLALSLRLTTAALAGEIVAAFMSTEANPDELATIERVEPIASAMKARSRPGIECERKLFANGCQVIAGLDEVGRGAWAGPVSVGVALVTPESLRRIPRGVRDSKVLSPRAREALFDPIVAAVTAYVVGHASPEECDALGMTAAQALAAERAFRRLPFHPDAIIVDGIHNYTGRSEAVTLVHGDRRSRVVAAASILAKVTRDRLMIEYASRFVGYAFESNKGYISAEHRRAVGELGMTSIHRTSWSVRSTGALASDEHALPNVATEDLDRGPARL